MSLPLKILVVLNGDGLSLEGLSGGAVRTYEMLRAWAATGKATPHAITTSGGLAKLRAYGLDWPSTWLRASFFGTRERFRFYRFVSYLISTIHFRFKAAVLPAAEMVISSSDFFCDTAPAFHLKRRRPSIRWIAMVYHLYTAPWKRPGNFLVNGVWSVLQRFSLKRIARHADGVMVHDTEEGDRVRDLLVQWGMNPVAIHPMRNGVRVARFARTAPARNPAFTALVVGELRPNKGVFDLVPIWQRVCADIPDARLLVVGGGAQRIRRGLETAIAVAELSDRMVLAGSITQEALVAAYHSARLLIAPSHEEGWGIAICEAMAAGLPVVAYDLPVYRRHYAGVIATTPCFNQPAFAETIVRLLKDTARLEQLIRSGKERAAQYDWDALAERDWTFVEQTVFKGAVQHNPST